MIGDIVHSDALSFVANTGNMICSDTFCNAARMARNFDLESPHGRLKWARVEADFESAAAFARAVQVNVVTYRAHEGGQNGFAEYAPQYARKLGVPAAWLLYGGVLGADDQPKQQVLAPASDMMPTRGIADGDGAIALRKIDMGLSMGPGTNIDDYFEEGVIDFDANLLRAISRAPTHMLVVANGVGDSMFPTIPDHAEVVIDLTQKVLNLTDRIWAISLYGAGGVKRLRPVAKDKIEVISDNPDHENQIVDAEDIRIIGRVVYSGRRH